MYFKVPALLWYWYTSLFESAGMCEPDSISRENLQLLVGVCSVITYKTGELVIFTPFAAYNTFYIEKVHGMSKATVCQFFVARLMMLVEFILLPVPVFLLIVKVMEWSQDYLVLVFFLATALVEIIIIWLYPKVINPLFADMKPLPENYGLLREEVYQMCAREGFNSK